MKKIMFFSIVVILAACNAKNNLQEKENISTHSESITVPIRSNLYKKIKTAKIVQEPYRAAISTFGIVRAIPNNYAEIAAPFAGRITRSFVKLGQHVAKDAPVFEICSPSYYESCKMYYQSKQEMNLADKNLKRQQDLYKNGVGIQKDLEEAEVNFELCKRDFENTAASLKVYKVDPESVVLGQPLIIRTPIAGDIVSNNIVIGKYLKEDADPVAVVAELNKVWIVGQVKEKDINSINELEEIEISSAALPDKYIKGTIYHISDLLDEETRSVQVYINCDNTNHALKPGMYVTVRFIEQPQQKMLIPSASVFQDEETSFVFVDEGNNRYTKRNVEVGKAANDRLLLKSGLNLGENIVVEGGYFLLEQN
ncbi:efflux RND transporter periplasmic adaptor subunit [Draconibacterium sp.]|nr:efflux RND transporter periplasmic adaptor subunit [Draconibacterium sp.]